MPADTLAMTGKAGPGHVPPSAFAVPWPAGPRLMLLVSGEDDGSFPSVAVAFPRLGVARYELSGEQPVVPRRGIPYPAWLAACGRALEERDHALLPWQGAEGPFLKAWVTSLGDYARYSFRRESGVIPHDVGAGSTAFDVGPYSGRRRWPGEGI